jgi:hypothetical protein
VFYTGFTDKNYIDAQSGEGYSRQAKAFFPFAFRCFHPDPTHNNAKFGKDYGGIS